MGWDNEAEEGLPPQRHREPTALRRDIVDELSDHLAQAADRETEAGAPNDQAVRTRVLNQFGNPAAVARALWWDAMKETVMKDWIQISINAILCIAVVGFMALIYGQMQNTNSALLSALNDRPAGVENLNPSIEFIFHRGSEDGPVAEGIRINLEGRAFNEEKSYMDDVSDRNGHAKFGPIRADRYTASFRDEETGMYSRQNFTLYSGQGLKTVHVAVPPEKPVPLNLTAPQALAAIDENVLLTMTMQSQWMDGSERWDGVSYAVAISPNGIFRSKTYPGNNDMLRPDEKVKQVYGNRLWFNNFSIAQSHYPEGGDEQWFSRINVSRYNDSFRLATISHELQPEGKNSDMLKVPKKILVAQDYYARLIANSHHGLPGNFAWFTETTTENYRDFVIDDARLVERSLNYHWTDDQYILEPDIIMNPIAIQGGLVFSLHNAPKSIPEGYRLLLAVRSTQNELSALNVNLCAYLDASPVSFNIDERMENLPPPQIGKPVWKLDARSITNPLFIDLTDAVNTDPDFKEATGLLFKWETPSRNALFLSSPVEQHVKERPVWLVLKPIGDGASSVENGV